MDVFTLSRIYWNFCFDNPELINPGHGAIYFFAIEHCNRLGWKDKFGFPSQMVMEAVGIRNWRTYQKYLNDLVEWGFIKMIETSKNQYSSNIIAIVKNTKAPTKALDKALSKHYTKHSQSIASINIQDNKEQYNNITTADFEIFWKKYPLKKGKAKAQVIFTKIINKEVTLDKLLIACEIYKTDCEKTNTFFKHGDTWLNQKTWLDYENNLKDVKDMDYYELLDYAKTFKNSGLFLQHMKTIKNTLKPEQIEYVREIDKFLLKQERENRELTY